MSLLALSLSDFISLLKTSNTLRERMNPFFCVASSLTIPEEVVLLMTVLMRSKCSRGCCATHWIAEDFPLKVNMRTVRKCSITAKCGYYGELKIGQSKMRLYCLLPGL